MRREEKYMRELGAWECEQRSPHHIYSVGKHTEIVVKYCRDHNASNELISAAWLHDSGKIATKRFDGKYDHFQNHPEISAEISEKLNESDYVIKLVKYHDAALGKASISIEELASNGRKWCDDLAILLMADLAGQHPTYRMGEKLQQRGIFLQKLYKSLDNMEKAYKEREKNIFQSSSLCTEL